MTKIPEPLHIFGDFNQESYVTAIDIHKSNNGEIFVICGYHNGLISTWLLSTYRCQQQIQLDDHIKDKNIELSPVRSLIYINARQTLVIRLARGNVLLFHFDLNDSKKFYLINHWRTFELTFAKMTSLIDDLFIPYLDPDNSNQINLMHLYQPNVIIKIIAKEKIDHGIIMAIHSFIDSEKFLYNFIAYEDGFLTINKSYFDSNKTIMDSETISSIQIQNEGILHMDYNDCVKQGIACYAPNEVVLWKCSIGNERLIDNSKIKRFTINSESITCCSIRPDGKIFAIGSGDGRIRIFSTKIGRPLAVISYHHESIETLRFTLNLHSNNDGDNLKKYLLFASSQDGSISIWSLYNSDSNL
ncbi:Guanine nucleotide binding protein (G protein), beta polypeptide 1-like [Dermatophagoides farinae]|uniref:Guanine nucleotide binding protein (G protein), beta polypeptide 1-like n=1 Tax=Dermatophagoides farinae TaxID=6954 RepID=A0A922L4T5_DERFA|nr:isoleucine-trna ligase [Dermatophagoides farinae]KAH9506739.1 Guanine nucleotide binding protein (G protein), beta polypeptide 1-like [Dermatophagoides farinae]